MEIKTKFNVGDKVWTFILIQRKFIVVESNIVCIDITVRKDNRIWISYTFEYGKELRNNFEQDCFATKEEAQAECDKRNKGE